MGVTKILKQDNNDIEGPVVAWHKLDCKPVLCDTQSSLVPTTGEKLDFVQILLGMKRNVTIAQTPLRTMVISSSKP